MQHRRQLMLIVFISCANTVFNNSNAQLNDRDSLNWQLKFSATGSLLDGSVSRLLLFNRLEAAYSKNLWGLSTRNDFQYGTTKHMKTENDIVSYNFLYLRPSRILYPYLMGLIETNYRRKIAFRYQAGPGVSYTIISKGKNLFRISVTGTYEHSEFESNSFKNYSDTTSQNIDVWRITGRLYGKQQLFKSRLNLAYEFWWQQAVGDRHNYRYYNEETIEIPIDRRFSFRTGFRYSFENVRLVGLKGYDLFWTFGLSLANF